MPCVASTPAIRFHCPTTAGRSWKPPGPAHARARLPSARTSASRRSIRKSPNICETAARRFEEADVIVEEASPDFSAAHDCFQVLRARSFAVSKFELLAKHRDLLKPEVIWNIEKGLALTMEEVARAEWQRKAMFDNATRFFAEYDLLLSPATIVAPYPVGQRYVEECDGHIFDNYVEWLAIAYAITLVCSPALSLPCGFTKEKLPVGLQIAGPCRGEAKVLAGAKVLEEILDLETWRPIEPVAG